MSLNRSSKSLWAMTSYHQVTYTLVCVDRTVNHKRVMREEMLLCRNKQHFIHKTDPDHGYRVYPNLIQGMLIEAPNTVCFADSRVRSVSQHVCLLSLHAGCLLTQTR